MKLRSVRVARYIIHRQAKIRYFTFAIFTILPFACGSFGSFTTVTYNSFSFSLKATFVVPSPRSIGRLTDAEGPHWFCVGMGLPFHKIVFDVTAEFVAKHIGAVF